MRDVNKLFSTFETEKEREINWCGIEFKLLRNLLHRLMEIYFQDSFKDFLGNIK